MKKNRKIKLIAGFLIFCIIALILFKAGTYLVVNETPHKVDAIVVISGDRGERTEYGVKLFKEGYAEHLIFSGGIVYNNVTMAELMEKHAIELGVSEDKILVENKADSTYENALFSKEILEKNNFKSAIVVSSNYHMRRTKMLFNRAFKKSDISLTFCASSSKYFNPNRWWNSNKSILMVVTEYIKLFGYALGKNS